MSRDRGVVSRDLVVHRYCHFLFLLSFSLGCSDDPNKDAQKHEPSYYAANDSSCGDTNAGIQAGV